MHGVHGPGRGQPYGPNRERTTRHQTPRVHTAKPRLITPPPPAQVLLIRASGMVDEDDDDDDDEYGEEDESLRLMQLQQGESRGCAPSWH